MLISKGWPAIFIAGNIEQNQRNSAITQLKEFKCRILVSTDLVMFVWRNKKGNFMFNLIFFRQLEE
jgi:ATP-dependent RNA helicase DDX20